MNPLRQELLARFAAISVAGLALAGCGAGGLDTTGLAGAASMRVEVEVYKGPLSKELEIQKAELAGKVREANEGLYVLKYNTEIAMCRLACFDRTSTVGTKMSYGRKDAKSVTKEITLPNAKTIYRDKRSEDFCADYSYEIEIDQHVQDQKFDICTTLDSIHDDVQTALVVAKELNLRGPLRASNPGNLNPNITTDLETDSPDPLYENVHRYFGRPAATADSENFGRHAYFAEFLRSRAAFWATAHTARAPIERRVRIAMADFAQFANEYGNQIGSRADALEKQVVGVDKLQVLRDQLATSVYLRDSAPTAFLNLYVHNDAAVRRGGLTTTDRVRLVEQLIADTYWSKINTVFATGQGKVSMAFIKDDIGNWNLKNFDNQPGELLNAYKAAGLAAVKAVAQLASPDKVGGGKKLLSFANQIATGETDGADFTATIAALHKRTAQALEDIGAAKKKSFDDLGRELGMVDRDIAVQEEKVQQATNARDTKAAAFDTAHKEEVTAEAELLFAQRQSPPQPDEIGRAKTRRDNAVKSRQTAEIELNKATGILTKETATLDELKAKKVSLTTRRDRLRDETIAEVRSALRLHGALIQELAAAREQPDTPPQPPTPSQNLRSR